MYRYIGNKQKLLPYLLKHVKELIGEKGIVADIMAGTGTVSLALRKCGYTVYASDVMTYSYHHLNANLMLCCPPQFNGLSFIFEDIKKVNPYQLILKYLNNLPGKRGFFYNEFSPDGNPENGGNPRKYFTSENASKIDAIREKINEWIETDKITLIEESVLKHTLIMAVNEIANISGTYGYFLSNFKKNALSSLILRPMEFYPENCLGHVVKQGFAESLASDIKADLCYIDPPYMKRQYAANYHILETLARGDFPDSIGKSGLRNWWDQHSKLCTKTQGLSSFDTIINKMNCPKFLISYSEDGLFSLDELINCFSKYGFVTTEEINYNRFKSNSSMLPKTLKEYIITVEKYGE